MWPGTTRRTVETMLSSRSTRGADRGLVEVAASLLLLQGSFTLLNALEAGLSGLVSGTWPVLLPAIGVNAAATALVLAVAAGLRRRSRRARRLALLVECLTLLIAAVDLGLSVALAREPFDLMPTVTRIVLPVVVIVLLRRPSVRATFPARPAREAA